MDRPGERLRRVRERLNMTYRQVAEASKKIAERRGSRDFALGISRLADIENRSKLPTIYRLYTLCAIYKLDFDEVLRWYGVPPEQLASDSLHTALPETHLLQFSHAREVTVPLLNEGTLQMESTSFLSRVIHRWGRMPFSFLNGVDTREFRYGWIGVEDWSMYPVLHPGSVLAIDTSRRKITAASWENEYDRPIYFFELRDGFRCGWCTLENSRLILETHPASHHRTEVFEWPRDIEVVGQVVGVAMTLRHETRRAHPKR